ncbi:Nicotinate-nucleotide pyrophosphorylase [carboxylating] [Polystyrenella longa]|uniref:Probable nicotinate-nucleotide pyrophosphorylase [carboxylating] n=1 Tax=Polystyrenella longa TaxID=2528007 RepID=A0A518CME3_9PLAN|nr:carboxylating nicotinate-nucleotide diphosphorylase [Polystyrenella longa]QDU80398.1 Nicotinate-nucleotide pyrophosphorylase [carboxylating] [Polystyrenella longa]
MNSKLLFGPPERDAARALIELALTEDLSSVGDLTSQTIIPETEYAEVQIVARQPGVLAGLPVAKDVFSKYDPEVEWKSLLNDGDPLIEGSVIATVSGPLRSLLTGERTALNFLTLLSGVASLTNRFVEEVAGLDVQILDTRKTFPGYRLLQKYAVRAGGGTNHRIGLYDGILIKDNHLAGWKAETGSPVAAAIQQARRESPLRVPIEVEVDTLDQLQDALEAKPEFVLLDNMTNEQLKNAVSLRNDLSEKTKLEASGGITLQTVREIAETGIDRISIGALTHSAVALDIAFDWSARLR